MTITNNRAANQFETNVEGGTAFLRYGIEGDTILLLYVEVPSEARGGGIAGEITRTALEFARQEGLKVIPVCGYVVAYLRRHAEYSDLTDS